MHSSTNQDQTPLRHVFREGYFEQCKNLQNNLLLTQQSLLLPLTFLPPLLQVMSYLFPSQALLSCYLFQDSQYRTQRYPSFSCHSLCARIPPACDEGAPPPAPPGVDEAPLPHAAAAVRPTLLAQAPLPHAAAAVRPTLLAPPPPGVDEAPLPRAAAAVRPTLLAPPPPGVDEAPLPHAAAAG